MTFIEYMELAEEMIFATVIFYCLLQPFSKVVVDCGSCRSQRQTCLFSPLLLIVLITVCLLFMLRIPNAKCRSNTGRILINSGLLFLYNAKPI
jgi:uncharacterized membrane protein